MGVFIKLYLVKLTTYLHMFVYLPNLRYLLIYLCLPTYLTKVTYLPNIIYLLIN
jgi:hypothetical protein